VVLSAEKAVPADSAEDSVADLAMVAVRWDATAVLSETVDTYEICLVVAKVGSEAYWLR
jgi:hypothetical protein